MWDWHLPAWHSCFTLPEGATVRRALWVAAGGGKEMRWVDEGQNHKVACHMVKQRGFTTDRVPHRQHGVGASECQVWEWDQTPALVYTPFLASAACVTGWRQFGVKYVFFLLSGLLTSSWLYELTCLWICKLYKKYMQRMMCRKLIQVWSERKRTEAA